MRRYRKIVIGLACALLVVLVVAGAARAFLFTEVTITPQAEPQGIEMPWARSRTSKTYDLGEGKYAIDTKIGSVHYWGEFGGWQEIDNQWSEALAPWDWEMLEDGYHTHVLEDFTAGQIMLFESQGESVAFQPMALEWTNDLDQIDQISMPQSVSATVSNDPVELLPGMSGSIGKIKWDDGYGTGRHFEWKNGPGTLQKLLTLDSMLPAPPEYIIDGGNPVARLNFIFDPSDDLDIYVDDALWDKSSDEQSFDTIEFRKGEGEEERVLWGFMPAAYWDSGDENAGIGITELRKVGNSLYVSVRVSHEWLETATYPVYIDPTLDLQVGANLDDVHEQEDPGTVTDGATYVRHSSGETAAGRYWGAHRWEDVSIPQGATIGVAYAELYIYSTSFDDADGFWHFEKGAFPARFSTDSGDVTDRDRTTESVAWNVDTLGIGWKGSNISLVDPLQEVIDDYSPTALVLIFRPNTVEAKNLFNTSHNDDPDLAAKLHIEYTAASNTLLLQVAADLDDVHENESSGAVYDDDSAVYHSANFQPDDRSWGAHRWVLGTSIPQGATIDECYIQLYSTTTFYDDMDGNWHFEELAAPAQFVVEDDNVTARDRTETSVLWQANSLGLGWVQSPELKTALQEVVDVYSSTVLVAIFRPNQTDDKRLYSRAHNNDPTLAARIFIKWTPAAAAEGYSYGTIIG